MDQRCFPNKIQHETSNYTLLYTSMVNIIMMIQNSEYVKWPKSLKSLNEGD